MKKLLLILIFILLPSISNAATTWYVRLDGGTPTQCDGTHYAAYPGTGSAQPCSLSHPAYVLGAGGSSLIAGGDTLIVDDINHSTNAQAQYAIGYGMPGTSGCSSSFPYACLLNDVPSGIDATHPTRILGVNYNTGCSTKPQLWGNEGVLQILHVSGKSNLDIECLEMTDHSNCGFRTGAHQCSEAYPADVGGYGRDGITGAFIKNLTLKNVDIHGLAYEGMNLGDLDGTNYFDHVNLDGNHFSGWDADERSNQGGNGSYMKTGAIVNVNYVKTRFSGCAEVYPRTSSFNTADYGDCTDQQASGYGDGWGSYLTIGSTFNITNSEWSHNSSDGLDALYGDPSNIINIDKSDFEGNVGNQLKFTAGAVKVTNSILVSNCDYLANTNKIFNTGTFTSCRANGTPISAVPGPNNNWSFINNSVISATHSGGSSFIELNNGGSCNNSELYKFSNNVVKSPNNTWVVEYNGGSDTCGAAFTHGVTNDHNNFYNFEDSPSGTGNLFTNPNWGGTYSDTADSNASALVLTSSSPAKGAGSANTFWNNSNDYNNFHQNSPKDQGAFQYTSTNQRCESPTFTCVATTDCCMGTCSNFSCSGSCTVNGGSCTSGTSCCTHTCLGGTTCGACLASGVSCTLNSDCCNGNCSSGTCFTAPTPTDGQSLNIIGCSLSGNNYF